METQTTKAGYKQTEVGLIPDDWECLSIKEFAIIKTGNKDTQDREDGAEYPFYVRSQTVENISTYSFDGEAVLTSGDGVGVGKIFHYVNGKFDYHQRVYNIHKFREDVFGKFFYYFFKGAFFDRVMSMTAKSSVDSVRREMIVDMLIPIPPIEEQKAIAQALGEIDDLIVSLAREIAKKQAIKQGAMQELLTGKRRLPAFDQGQGYQPTELGLIPEDWVNNFLDICCNIEGGYAFDSKKFNSVGEYQVIKMSNLYGGKLNLERSKSFLNDLNNNERNYLLNTGDILITLTGTTGKDDYGYSYRISNERNLVVNQRVGRIKCNEDTSSLFLSYAIKMPVFLQQFFEISKGGTGNQTNVGVSDIAKIKIPLPPTFEEQKAIASILSDMDTEISELERKKAKYERIKQGMMQELLTGKTRLV